MKRIQFIAAWVVIWLLITGYWSLTLADYVPGEVLVKFKPGVIGMTAKIFSADPSAAKIYSSSVKALMEKFEVEKIERIYYRVLEVAPKEKELLNYYKLIFPREKNVEEVVESLKKDPNVVYAQPNFIYRAFVTPNDSRFGDQWGLTKIKADYGWEVTVGTAEVKIAVIDTGVDYSHEDLQGRIDLAGGYDFVNDDSDPMDDEGHGTGVAGVIAAATNNGIGIAGVDWRAKIIPLKALKPEEGGAGGTVADIIEAIDWARTHEAKVINLSLGQSNYDYFLEEACRRAYSAGITLVAAAGNDGTETKNYPAAFDTVLAVAATDNQDKRSVWNALQSSNYGSWIDISAPGSGILTTRWGGGYLYMNGTSLASPFVAGLASLILSRDLNMAPSQIYARIKNTADNIDSLNPGYDGKLGTGRINVYRALTGIDAEISSPSSGECLAGEKEVRGTAAGLTFGSYFLEALKNGSLSTIEAKSSSVEAGLLGIWNTRSFSDGEYTLRLRVFSSDGYSVSAQVNVTLDNTSPEAAISYPTSGTSEAGRITVRGKAFDANFEKYVLRYAREGSSTLETIGAYFSPISDGILGTWEASGLSGRYVLYLDVYDKAGNRSSISVEVTALEATPTKEIEPQTGLPLTFALPNPFDRKITSEASFIYYLAGNFDTTVYLFDLNGNLIWRKSYSAGENGGKSGKNNPTWDGKDLYGQAVENGVYLYQVVADGKIIGRGKIIVLN